ncbi:hypothetical protein B5S31_g1839 [[Candida] boidinii]|nr:hypothetical protein B5S31_g1839 [[Candida] boidinii]
MSLSSWRQFPFFEHIPIRDPNYGSDEALYSDSTISSVCSTSEYFITANTHSTVKIIDKSFQLVLQFQAYETGWSISHIKYIDLAQIGFLCTIAERQGQPCSLKLWNIKKLLFENSKKTKKKTESYLNYHTQCQIHNGQNNYPITSFDYSPDFSILAFGFGNGSVILVRGDLIHDRGSRQRIVYEGKDPITAVHFKDESLLYVTTVSKILTIPTTGRNNGQPERILDDKNGVDINCSSILNDDSKSNLIVAKDDGLEFYNSKGKTNNILLTIPKKKLFTFNKKYALIITSLNSNILSNNQTSTYEFSTTKAIIVDVTNRFIVFNQTLSSSVLDIFDMWGDTHILTADGFLLRLHELSMREKIDILVQRELFPIAIKLGSSDEAKENSEITGDFVLNIKKHYGDFLYNKGDFEEAIKQYSDCISLGKNSEIIQKYKDSYKIKFLTYYLEKMIDLKKSNEDHVTLLLCSFCKLKEIEKLKSFIDNIEIDDSNEIINNYKKFDLYTVIRLCRESGYYRLACLMAQKFNDPLIMVDIQLNELNNPEATMKYICSLNVDDLLRVLVDNVSILLNKLPNETTALLIDVFTGRYKPKFTQDSLNYNKELTKKKSAASEVEDNNDENHVIQSYKAFASFMRSKGNLLNYNSTETVSEDGDNNIESQPTYLPPRPRIIFQSFVNYPNQFVIFLEACVESYDKFGGNTKDKNDILITLFEMYLSMARNVSKKDKDYESKKKVWESKAKELGEIMKSDKAKNDPTSSSTSHDSKSKDTENDDDITMMLLLSNLNEFNEGEILAREGPGFEIDLFRSRVAAGDVENAVAVLKKYGEVEPELYKLVLTYYISDPEVFHKVGIKEFEFVLEKIRKNKLMTPLEVIQALSITNVATIGLIKQYLLQYINIQKQEILNNELLIKSYKDETVKNEEQINKLINEPSTIQNTKCNSCSLPLDFPTIHFMCHHSYHERCLSDIIGYYTINNTKGSSIAEKEAYDDSGNLLLKCPKCVGEFDAIEALRKSQEEVGVRNDLFKSALNDSSDKFKVMCNFFGRGAMEQTKYIISNDD